MDDNNKNNFSTFLLLLVLVSVNTYDDIYFILKNIFQKDKFSLAFSNIWNTLRAFRSQFSHWKISENYISFWYNINLVQPRPLYPYLQINNLHKIVTLLVSRSVPHHQSYTWRFKV